MLMRGIWGNALCLAMAFVLLAHAPASAFEHAILAVDSGTGRIFFQHNADKLREPASLTKMMTLYIMFEALDAGQMRLTDLVTFSQRASSEPSMKLGVGAGQSVSVEDAILSLIVVSANDVATAVAEKLAGSEQAFARLMNMKARQLKMHNTSFTNAHGLHNPNQITTAKDMAKLAISLRAHFPHYYHYFSRDELNWGGKVMRSHNSVTSKYVEVDGLKTGYTSVAKYNLATSVTCGDFGLVAVVMGVDSVHSRDSFMELLINTIAEKKTGQPLTVSPEFVLRKVAGSTKTASKKKRSNSTKAKNTKVAIASKGGASEGAVGHVNGARHSAATKNVGSVAKSTNKNIKNHKTVNAAHKTTVGSKKHNAKSP